MNKFQILIVEDDPPIRNLIATTLKTHDYKYLLAKNGEEALLSASTYAPDVVFLDLGLPDIDGVEIIKRIREWSNMPIIVISARSEDEDKIEALDAGADDYLTKPFSIEELLARLRVMQRRIALLQADADITNKSIYENGCIKIDYAAGCVYKKDKEWFGNLNMLIFNFNEAIDNRTILPTFAERRIDCKQKCLQKNGCQFCQRIANLSKTLENKSLIIQKEE